MKTKFFLSLVTFIIFTFNAFAGENIKESEFKVSGNCSQCKTRIEKAMKISEVKYAKWEKKSKMLTVAYLSEKITLDSLEQRVASVGHDTEKFKAADDAYNNLPSCCLYRGEDKTH